jgi:hypothetical protein
MMIVSVIFFCGGSVLKDRLQAYHCIEHFHYGKRRQVNFTGETYLELYKPIQQKVGQLENDEEFAALCQIFALERQEDYS